MILLILFFLLSYFLETVSVCLIKDFIPFFVLAIVLFSNVLMNNDKKCYIFLFIIGIIYDLTFTTAVFLHGFIFVLLSIFLKTFLKKYHYIKMLFAYYLVIIIYNFFMLLLTFLYMNNNYLIMFNDLLSSIFLNTLYFTFIYLSFFVYKCFICNTKAKKSYF